MGGWRINTFLSPVKPLQTSTSESGQNSQLISEAQEEEEDDVLLSRRAGPDKTGTLINVQFLCYCVASCTFASVQIIEALFLFCRVESSCSFFAFIVQYVTALFLRCVVRCRRNERKVHPRY